MLITHKKLQPVQCYHIFSNPMVVYLAKNHYGSYSPQMVPTNPPGSWPIMMLHFLSRLHTINDIFIELTAATEPLPPSKHDDNGRSLVTMAYQMSVK